LFPNRTQCGPENKPLVLNTCSVNAEDADVQDTFSNRMCSSENVLLFLNFAHKVLKIGPEAPVEQQHCYYHYVTVPLTWIYWWLLTLTDVSLWVVAIPRFPVVALSNNNTIMCIVWMTVPPVAVLRVNWTSVYKDTEYLCKRLVIAVLMSVRKCLCQCQPMFTQIAEHGTRPNKGPHLKSEMYLERWSYYWSRIRNISYYFLCSAINTVRIFMLWRM